MQTRVSTYVYADDPILQAGVVSQLRMRPEIDVVEAGELAGVDVGIAVADTLDDETIRILRSLKKAGVGHTILVMSSIDETTVVNAAEVGVSGLLRRGEATRICWSARSRRWPRVTASSPPICSAICWGRSDGFSARYFHRAA